MAGGLDDSKLWTWRAFVRGLQHATRIARHWRSLVSPRREADRFLKSAEVLATGVQPTRKALPQLVDGLSPQLHLQAALATMHPLSYPPVATDPVEYALKLAPDDVEVTRARRLKMCKLLRELA